MRIPGVHSIERSPQEDALLVLFNTAISNLVRLIFVYLCEADNFTTIFRSCSGTTLLCPATLPTSFNHSKRPRSFWILGPIPPYSNQHLLSSSRYDPNTSVIDFASCGVTQKDVIESDQREIVREWVTDLNMSYLRLTLPPHRFSLKFQV
jgi:hypothetical protein